MDSDKKGVIIYTDKVVSYFDSQKDPHCERRLRKTLRRIRDHFSPTKLGDFDGYKGTSTVKKATPDQYRAVFVWIPETEAPFRVLQVVKVFNKKNEKAPSPGFLEQVDHQGIQLRDRLRNASDEEIDVILENLGTVTEAKRTQR